MPDASSPSAPASWRGSSPPARRWRTAPIRRAVAFSAAHDLEESLAHEAELMALTGATADHTAAVEAFLAKRKPDFEGR